jgi:3-dehydroquinate synthetase
MGHDKKVRDGIVRFVLANKIGQVSFGQAVPREMIERALDEPSA